MFPHLSQTQVKLNCEIDEWSPTFWHQGPGPWKTIFPRMGGGVRGCAGCSSSNASDGERQRKLRLPAAHLLLCGLAPNKQIHDRDVRIYHISLSYW